MLVTGTPLPDMGNVLTEFKLAGFLEKPYNVHAFTYMVKNCLDNQKKVVETHLG